MEDRYPELRSMLCIGGIDAKPMFETIKRGVHMVVGQGAWDHWLERA